MSLISTKSVVGAGYYTGKFDQYQYEHSGTIRGNQDIQGAIASSPSPASIELAPDQWGMAAGIEIDQPTVLRGRELATRIQANAGAISSTGGYLIKINEGGAGSIIEGIRFHGADANGPQYAIWLDRAHSVVIRNCEFKYFASSIFVYLANYVRVESCKFFDQSKNAILWSGSSHGQILNNMAGASTGASEKEIKVFDLSQFNLILGNSLDQPSGTIYIDQAIANSNRYGSPASGYGTGTHVGLSNYADMEIV